MVASKFNMTLAEQFHKARKVGVPLVGIETPDPFVTIQALLLVNSMSAHPAFAWNLIQGLIPANTVGDAWLQEHMPDVNDRKMNTINPTEMLALAATLPPRATLFFHNAHRFLAGQEGTAPMQAIANLRDVFKADGRMLVLLAPVLKLPVELERDIVVFEQALTTDEERSEILQHLYSDATLPKPDTETLATLVDATKGLAAFPTEQVAALALEKTGISLEQVWKLKRKMIEQTKGLSLLEPKETFENIGGLTQAKKFGTLLFAGRARPTCIVFMDEIEKSFAGASGLVGDSTGVAQDQLGVILNRMEETNATGMINVGPPGSGKSLYAKTLGATFNVPVVQFDLGALKGSLVGESETAMRQAMKTIYAIAGEGAFYVATCNALDTLPSALRRRFRRGIWFFDLPDASEQEAIWKVNLKRYGLSPKLKRPAYAHYTGADIRNLCENAWAMDITLEQAADYITPVAKSDPKGIQALRNTAQGHFLSASYPGFYAMPTQEARVSRTIQLGE